MDGWIAHFGQWVWPHLNIIHMFYLLQVIKRAVSPKKLRSKNYVLILYEVNSSNKYILKIKLHPKHSSKYLVWNKCYTWKWEPWWKSGWNLKLATLHWDGCIVHWDTFLQTPISEPPSKHHRHLPCMRQPVTESCLFEERWAIGNWIHSYSPIYLPVKLNTDNHFYFFYICRFIYWYRCSYKCFVQDEITSRENEQSRIIPSWSRKTFDLAGFNNGVDKLKIH